jgi:hypothetical protein
LALCACMLVWSPSQVLCAVIPSQGLTAMRQRLRDWNLPTASGIETCACIGISGPFRCLGSCKRILCARRHYSCQTCCTAALTSPPAGAPPDRHLTWHPSVRLCFRRRSSQPGQTTCTVHRAVDDQVRGGRPNMPPKVMGPHLASHSPVLSASDNQKSGGKQQHAFARLSSP